MRDKYITKKKKKDGPFLGNQIPMSVRTLSLRTKLENWKSTQVT